MSGSVTLEMLFAQARARLLEAHIGEAALDARVLLCGLLGLSATRFVSDGSEPVAAEDVARVRAAVERRAAHEPVHRILGAREFYGIELAMSAETLEPRPDTEALVELLLPSVQAIVAQSRTCRILDLGTGTGAICLALLHAVPEATGTATDLSEGALVVAQANARTLGLDGRFRTIHSDWFGSVDGIYDVIASNPPYIRTAIVETLAPEVRDHDPALALDGGIDGLAGYRAIAEGCQARLSPGGVVGVEIGYDQREPVTALFTGQGMALVSRSTDLGGNDRALLFAKRQDEHI